MYTISLPSQFSSLSRANFFRLPLYMKLQAIHLLLILIGALILCSALGGCGLREGFESDVDHTSYTGPAGDKVDVYSRGDKKAVKGPKGNVAVSDDYPSYDVSSSTTAYVTALPKGIPRAQIPAGDEDLYILKSQVVPPVCPACPQRTACPRQEPCPPCPPCARCPEPSFECKKVPNFQAAQSNFLPRPVLTDFSQFGM